MMLTLLFANLVHGLIGLVWIVGLRQLAAPVPVAMWARLLTLVLVLPPLIGLARVLGLPPAQDEWLIVRVESWLEWLRQSGGALPWALVVLMSGTTVVFALQELLPAWQRWRHRLGGGEPATDERVLAALERARSGYRAAGGVPPDQIARIHILVVDSEEKLAALRGLRHPTILLSRGLLGRLDDDELEAVIAHELAHVSGGGNLGFLVIWFLRAVQAASPAALITFRRLVVAREEFCDELAAAATGKPMALASAILKVHGTRSRLPRSAGSLARARAELQRRGDLAATRMRVGALLDRDDESWSGAATAWTAAIVLGAMMWLAT
jgi:Zn-dependent protease with chaperone function